MHLYDHNNIATMQYQSDIPRVLLCPSIQFWDGQVKAFYLAPQGGRMDAHLSGSGCPVPVVSF
jgi:hypothetical protein